MTERPDEASVIADESHVLAYRAGVAGLSHVQGFAAGIPGLGRAQSTEPHWYCSCGGWRFRATAMPHRRTGNNKIEAERAFKLHLGRL